MDGLSRMLPATTRLPEVEHSSDWYRGWRYHLGFARITNPTAASNRSIHPIAEQKTVCMSAAAFENFLGVVVILHSLLLLLFLGLPALFAVKLREETIGHLTKLMGFDGLIANLGILGMMLIRALAMLRSVRQLASILPEHFHFHIKFEFDRLSVPMSLLSFVLCGTIGAFANVYLHRDAGYRRFSFCLPSS